MTLMLIVVAVLVGGVVAFNVFKGAMIRKFMASSGEPPQTVTTIVANRSEWIPELQAVGTLRAVRGVDISPEVAGTVRHLSFHSGQSVKAGEVLVEFVNDAEKAQLKSFEAGVNFARITLERDRAQLSAQAISQAQLDADIADLQSKEAQWSLQNALLAKKSLVAPFGGRLGISTINPGQFLNPGDKIVTLQEITPILVDFTVPQQQVSQLSVGRKVSLSADAWPNKVFSGKISAISPLVDGSTRNIAVEAQLENPRQELLPGMFGKVRLVHGEKQSLITLPQSAVAFNPYGATIFIVKTAPKPAFSEAGKPVSTGLVAEQVFVTTGATRGDQVAILSGLEAGATVVTSGQLKLKSGTPLIVNEQQQPPNDPAPTPQEK
ncbi:MAG: efflux RND transporter periplasmic adaptor subunit [Ferrovum sp.]|nr:efflux RND transporter periplasmic adaptor subunit [Ferrovum sp.]